MFDDEVEPEAIFIDKSLLGGITADQMGISIDDEDMKLVTMDESEDTQEIVADATMVINSQDIEDMDQMMFDDEVEPEAIVEPTLISDTSSHDDALDPFILQHDSDENSATRELIVQPPSIPPQLSDFTLYQNSMVVMTREERIALADQSFLSLEVKPGVKADTIKGAAIATFVLALLAGDEVPIALLGMVPAVSYFAITRGKTGETIRIIGDLSWLWTSKFTETLTTLDASQLVAFWNTVLSITSKFWTNFGVWLAQQSELAEEEYYLKQSAVARIDALPESSDEVSDYFFISTSDQPIENETQEIQVPHAISQSEQMYEKELEDIKLLLEEAEREHSAARIRSDKKVRERFQRQLLTTKLDMDLRSSKMKQSHRDLAESRLRMDDEINRQKLIEANQRALLESRLSIERVETARANERQQERNNRISTEAKQRSLLEARLTFDRKHMAIVNETRRLTAEADRKKRNEVDQRSLLEYRLSFERNLAAQFKVATQLEDAATSRKLAERNQRSLLETRLSIVRNQRILRAEEESIARIEDEKRLADAVVEAATNRKLAERNQRSLLETRLSIVRNQRILRAEEESIARIEDEKRLAEAVEHARIQEEKRLASIDEQIRLEEESRSAERSRIKALAKIEEQNRRARLLAEKEEMAKIEAEKRRVATAERARLAKIDERNRLEESSRIAEISRIEELAQIEEENRLSQEAKIINEDEYSLVVEDILLQDASKSDDKNQYSDAPISDEGIRLDTVVSTGELQSADSRSMRDRSVPTPVEIDIQKPNIDAAKALLESVRKGESYQFKKEWWE